MKAYLLCAMAMTMAALTFPAYAQYKPIAADGIAASPKVRQLLSERQSSTVRSSVPVRSVACPKCIDIRIVGVRPEAKGAEVLAGAKHVAYKHTCAGCETRWTVAGAGKAKHSVATHQCTAQAPNNMLCCGTK